MIVDASALVAVVFQEPGYERIVDRLREAGPSGIAAPTFVEAGIVISARLRADGASLLIRLMRELNIQVVPFGEEHAFAALSAWIHFGKGQHPAGLNFGDCIAYAVAKLSKLPLLCTGADFSKTDITLA